MGSTSTDDRRPVVGRASSSPGDEIAAVDRRHPATLLSRPPCVVVVPARRRPVRDVRGRRGRRCTRSDGSSGSSPAPTYCTDQPVRADHLGEAGVLLVEPGDRSAGRVVMREACAGAPTERGARSRSVDRRSAWGRPTAGCQSPSPAASRARLRRLPSCIAGHPRDRDGVPLGDQVGRQGLRLGQLGRPLGREAGRPRRHGEVRPAARRPARPSRPGRTPGSPGRMRGL